MQAGTLLFLDRGGRAVCLVGDGVLVEVPPPSLLAPLSMVLCYDGRL